MAMRRSNPTVRSTGNRFMPGGNKFSPRANPYAPNGRTDSTDGQDPATPPKPETPKQDDMNGKDSEYRAKTGYLHAVAGLVPDTTDDPLYMVGYDEGTAVRALHLAGHHADVAWFPLGPRGVRAVGALGHEAVAVPTATSWEWWITDSSGMEVVAGWSAEIDLARDEIEARLADLTVGASLSAVVADVMSANPELPAREAVRIARRAMRIITETGGR